MTQLRTVPDTDWVIPLMIGVAVAYVINRLLFPRYHARISHAFFNRYEANKLIAEKNVLLHRGGYILNLLPLFLIAIIVYQQMGYFRHELLLEKPFYHYSNTLIITAIYFVGRVLAVTLFGFSFEQREIAMRFNQVWLLQFENLGTFILVPALVLPFTAGTVHLILLIMLWALLVFWLIFTIIRELELLQSYRVSLFYMFLYLCTLEILPLWWAVQAITEGW